MKKTFDWFDSSGIAYHFHNYKIDNISAEILQRWMKTTPLEVLVNTKGTTFRALSDIAKKDILNQKKAIKLIQQNPSIIKRPVVENGENIFIGYLPEVWKQNL